MITLVHALTRQEQLVSYLNVYLFHESTFPARDSNVKFFRWRYRNKPPLFPHLYFISTAWVPSEPKLRPLASISISIACLVIAKPLHHDTPSFMQISNWLLVKMCSAIIVHQKKKKLYSVAETKLTSHEGTNGHRLKWSVDRTTLRRCDCITALYCDGISGETALTPAWETWTTIESTLISE